MAAACCLAEKLLGYFKPYSGGSRNHLVGLRLAGGHTEPVAVGGKPSVPGMRTGVLAPQAASPTGSFVLCGTGEKGVGSVTMVCFFLGAVHCAAASPESGVGKHVVGECWRKLHPCRHLALGESCVGHGSVKACVPQEPGPLRWVSSAPLLTKLTLCQLASGWAWLDGPCPLLPIRQPRVRLYKRLNPLIAGTVIKQSDPHRLCSVHLS